MIKKPISFKQFLKTADRSNHLAWGPDDIKHDTKHEEDRSSHLAWGPDDIKHDTKEPIKEDYGIGWSGPGGQKNLGKVPKHWSKGQPSNIHTVDKDRIIREPKPYHSDDPGQKSLDLPGGENHTAPMGGPNNPSITLSRDHPHHDLNNDDDAAEFVKHASKFSPLQVKAVNGYKSNSSAFNRPLRRAEEEGDTHLRVRSQYHSRIRLMDRVVNHPISKNLTVYRGIHPTTSEGGKKKGDAPDISEMPIGHEFHDDGYTGVSTHKDKATNFGHSKEGIDGRRREVVARINVPAGTKGYYADHQKSPKHSSPYAHERELILHRGTKFRVTGHSYHDDPHTGDSYHMVHMDVVGQHPKKLKKDETAYEL